MKLLQIIFFAAIFVANLLMFLFLKAPIQKQFFTDFIKQKPRFIIAIFFVQLFFINNAFARFRAIEESSCSVDKQSSEIILSAVKDKDPDVIKSLSSCLKYNHKIIFQACLIDPSQLENADSIFRNDENFIYRLVKANPEILQYIAPELKKDAHFVEKAAYLTRDALKYADPKLLDNKPFMERAIKLDSRNYIYASTRIKEISEIAAMAFEDDGLLLQYAPEPIKNNRNLVKIALKSNSAAIEYASDYLKKDIEMRLLANAIQMPLNNKKIEEFLLNNYVATESRRNIGQTIDKKTKFFKKHRLINRNYITKWQRIFEFNGNNLQENLHLIAAESRNNPNRWIDDFKKYPDLTKKIKNFFAQRNIDKETIDNLSLTYLWKIKDKPLTLAFNLYLLRDSDDEELGPEYVSVTSLTAIAQKIENDWKITVIEVIFDSEIKADIAYENGQKKYILQDLYVANKDDKNPKLIFRVEDKYAEYFEVFSEQKGGKYKMIYTTSP